MTIDFDDPLTGDIAQPAFALVELNRTTLATIVKMAEIAPVVAIVSRVHAGKSVFGVPVVAHAPDGVVRLIDLGPDKLASYATSLDPMARNLRAVIADGLPKMDLLSVHRMSASLLSAGLKGASQELDNYIFRRFNSRLPASVKVCEGTVLGYGGIGTVINKSATIGRNCVVGQNVTIGARSSDAPPVIGGQRLRRASRRVHWRIDWVKCSGRSWICGNKTSGIKLRCCWSPGPSDQHRQVGISGLYPRVPIAKALRIAEALNRAVHLQKFAVLRRPESWSGW